MSQELCSLLGSLILDSKDRLPSLCGHLAMNTCSSFMGAPKVPCSQAVTFNILRVTTDFEAWRSGCSPKSCQGEAQAAADALCKSTPSCQRLGFGFCDHRSLFEEEELLVEDGTCLTQWQEHLCKDFASHLANW